MARYDTILDTIGNTPLVRLHRLAPAGINLYVKVEAFNPMGSVKDRMALAVIEDAERRGALQPGQTVIEATSGNTGIGLAMVCAQKGYPLVVTMAENFSVERRRLLRFLGAKVVLTPAAEKGSGMLAKAVELAERHGYFLCRQFENEANAAVHSRTTAQEILADFADQPLHYWVSGFGTGGTLKGVSRVLKAASPATQVIVAEPDNAPLLGSGIPQPRAASGQPEGSHPQFRPHLMQGWSPDFISPLTEQALADGCVDRVVPVAGQAALDLARALARQEGIFAGITSGATLAAALTIAREAPAGSNIVCMLPDTGERYLSTQLFSDISEAMDAEELALSDSTPGYRFVTASTATPAAAPATRLDPAVKAQVEAAIAAHPVVMFALEWCEFCWAVRKLFQQLDVPYHSVDLDSVAYQQDDLGVRMRPVLAQLSGAPTIPQIFIGGHWVGGCSELFGALQDGSLRQRLLDAGLADIGASTIDPAQLLPQWLQPRR